MADIPVEEVEEMDDARREGYDGILVPFKALWDLISNHAYGREWAVLQKSPVSRCIDVAEPCSNRGRHYAAELPVYL